MNKHIILNIFRFVKFSFWFIGWIRWCCIS